jgi:hypothetical protein
VSRWWDDREDSPRVQWLESAWKGLKILMLVYLGIGVLYTIWAFVASRGSDPPFPWALAVNLFLWPVVIWFKLSLWMLNT